jgi:hypothetical protein
MEESLKLDGRDFAGTSQSLTAAQDDYILAHLRLAGVLEVFADMDGPVKKGRSAEERARDLLTRILLSGRAPFILSGCLTETGKHWSREEADSNAARFAEITDDDEKKAMRASIVKFIIGFFGFGEKSPATSRKSSSRKKTDRPGESAEAATSAASPQ